MKASVYFKVNVKLTRTWRLKQVPFYSFIIVSPPFCSASNLHECSVAEGAAVAPCTGAATVAGRRTSARAVSCRTSRRCGRRAPARRPRTEAAPRRPWGWPTSTRRPRPRAAATRRRPAASAARCRRSTPASEAPFLAQRAGPRPCTAHRHSPPTRTHIRYSREFARPASDVVSKLYS